MDFETQEGKAEGRILSAPLVPITELCPLKDSGEK